MEDTIIKYVEGILEFFCMISWWGYLFQWVRLVSFGRKAPKNEESSGESSAAKVSTPNSPDSPVVPLRQDPQPPHRFNLPIRMNPNRCRNRPGVPGVGGQLFTTPDPVPPHFLSMAPFFVLFGPRTHPDDTISLRRWCSPAYFSKSQLNLDSKFFFIFFMRLRTFLKPFSFPFPFFLSAGFTLPPNFYSLSLLVVWEIFTITVFCSVFFNFLIKLAKWGYEKSYRVVNGMLFGQGFPYPPQPFDPAFLIDPYSQFGIPDLFFHQVFRLVYSVKKGWYMPNETTSRFMAGLEFYLEEKLAVFSREHPISISEYSSRPFLTPPSDLTPLSVTQIQRLLLLCREYRIVVFHSVSKRNL